MLADFEYRFNDHEDTIRRAEANARLQSALASTAPTSTESKPPRRGISLILRRLAGTAVAAA
jgi:hypothetical protein